MPTGYRMETQFVSRRKIYLACEELNFVWDRTEVSNFRNMWDDGKSIRQIAEVLDRDPDEVLILAIDQCKEGYITQRQGGLLGRMA